MAGAAIRAACSYAGIRDASLIKSELFIGGKWLAAASTGESFTVRNPATGLDILQLPKAGVPEAAACVSAARLAAPAWAKRTAASRADVRFNTETLRNLKL